MLYRTLQKMIERSLTEGLLEKIDIFFAVGRLKEEEYFHLIDQLDVGLE